MMIKVLRTVAVQTYLFPNFIALHEREFRRKAKQTSFSIAASIWKQLEWLITRIFP